MWRHPWQSLSAIWLAMTLILGLVGPFGTFPALGFGERLIYWGSIIALSIALAVIVRVMVVSVLGRDRHPLVVDAVGVPLFVFLYTPPLHLITRWTAEGYEPFSRTQMGLIVLGVTLALILLREVFGLNAPGVRGRYRDLRHRAAHVETPRTTPEPALPPDGKAAGGADESPVERPANALPALVTRLPDALQAEVLAISGSDHYVEVRTAKGQGAILLRFSDALRELAEVDGLRVHRSHWVADAAVHRFRRDGHRHFVVLKTGEELPVSRTYAQSARERWG
ncbi:MAG: LytTR family DNA-binding domain-containing protein [Pararhodobacter sp.]